MSESTATPKPVTAREAITRVLKKQNGPMKVPALIEAVLKTRNLSLTGDNRGQTIYSIIYSENKKPDGAFKRVGKGEFILNPNAKAPAAKAKAAKAVEVKADPKPVSKNARRRSSRAKTAAAA